MGFRVEQVNSLIQKDLGLIMSRDLELDEGAFITVTRVETCSNLKFAKVFVTILPEKDRDDIFVYLQKNAARLKKELSKGLTMKFSPSIKFYIDEIEEHAGKIEDLLDSLRE